MFCANTGVESCLKPSKLFLVWETGSKFCTSLTLVAGQLLQCTKAQEFSLQISKKKWLRGFSIWFYCPGFGTIWQSTKDWTFICTRPWGRHCTSLVLLWKVFYIIMLFQVLLHLYLCLLGILLPLLESGNCTLREAIIIGSVVARNSIPILHSSAAMLKIAEMDYTGANSIFLRIFLDKKYALPYRVVDALVFHFTR